MYRSGAVLFSGESYAPGERFVVSLAGDGRMADSGKAQFRATAGAEWVLPLGDPLQPARM